ncbi:hypothetical protein ABIC08_006891 [Bradyrhizobium sp. RT9b]
MTHSPQMGRYGSVTGRRLRKAIGLPQGVGWCVPVPRDLLNSFAWLAMSDQCRKLIDALMAEHADHGGLENGNLMAPYNLLQARGMRRGNILNAIVEADALGIVDPTRGARSYGSRRAPSRYRLTWMGTPDGLMATNEWRSIKTAEQAKLRVSNALDRLKRERAIRAANRTEFAAKRADRSRVA